MLESSQQRRRVFDLAIHLALWLLFITLFAILGDLATGHVSWRDDPVAGIETLVRYYLEQCTDPDLAR
jgi:hypothetical protein